MILAGQLRSYASLHMPEDNVSVSGGSIDLTTVLDFSDVSVNDGLQVVSSQSGDISAVVVTGRLANGSISSESVNLNSTSPVPTIQVAWERIMKVVKSSSTLGDIAVERLAAVYTGTVVTVSSDRVTLAGTASSVNNAYTGMVFRVLSGTGQFGIAKVIMYDGLNRILTLDQVLTLDSSSSVRLSQGVVLNKSPNEIMTVRRPFYNAVADSPGGQLRLYFEKFFWKNDSTELLQSASVSISDPTGLLSFALDSVNPSIGSVINRLTQPIGLTFDTSVTPVPTTLSDMSPNQSVGAWLMYTIKPGQNPIKSGFTCSLVGITT